MTDDRRSERAAGCLRATNGQNVGARGARPLGFWFRLVYPVLFTLNSIRAALNLALIPNSVGELT
jgi:hypothetical protein